MKPSFILQTKKTKKYIPQKGDHFCLAHRYEDINHLTCAIFLKTEKDFAVVVAAPDSRDLGRVMLSEELFNNKKTELKAFKVTTPSILVAEVVE